MQCRNLELTISKNNNNNTAMYYCKVDLSGVAFALDLIPLAQEGGCVWQHPDAVLVGSSAPWPHTRVLPWHLAARTKP